MPSRRVLLSIHHELDADTGAPGATLALGQGLADLGHQVEYLSFDDMPVRSPYLAANVAYPFFAAARFAAAKRRGVDVIDASTGDAWIWGGLEKRPDRPLLVTRSHGLEHLFQAVSIAQMEAEGQKPSRRYPLYWGGYRLREVAASMRRSDLVLVFNGPERDYAAGHLGVDPERIRLVTNGVPTDFLDAAAKAKTSPDSPRIAFVNAYRAWKGVFLAAEAMVEAMGEDPELRASFFGVGVPAATVLENFPKELHDRVTVVERFSRGDLPEILAGHSVLLFPSVFEGFSLTLVEGMACGLIPVAFDIAPISRVVEDGRNGLLVPSGSAPDLAAALLRLRREPETARRLAGAAREKARAYGWPQVAAETSDLYEEALELRRRG
jgi:glycosyltransferase involved in cell wall biosynthesis